MVLVGEPVLMVRFSFSFLEEGERLLELECFLERFLEFLEEEEE